MGDDRGTDYVARRNEEYHARLVKETQKRLDHLYDMATDVGLGSSNSGDSIQDMITSRLREAENLIEVWLKANKEKTMSS